MTQQQYLDFESESCEIARVNEGGYKSSLFVNKNTILPFQCAKCHQICYNAVELTCYECNFEDAEDGDDTIPIFCELCIKTYLNMNNNTCPLNKFHKNVTYKINKDIQNDINNLTIHCPLCPWMGTLNILSIHLQKECKANEKNTKSIKCKYSEYGCSFIGTSKLLQIHNQQQMTNHLDLLSHAIKQKNNDNIYLKTENDKLWKYVLKINQIKEIQPYLNRENETFFSSMNSMLSKTKLNSSSSTSTPTPTPTTTTTTTTTTTAMSTHPNQRNNVKKIYKNDVRSKQTIKYNQNPIPPPLASRGRGRGKRKRGRGRGRGSQFISPHHQRRGGYNQRNQRNQQQQNQSVLVNITATTETTTSGKSGNNSYGDGDIKKRLNGCIDEYLISGNIDKFFNFKGTDFKVWASIINEGLRDRKPAEIKYFNNLICYLFKHGILHNKQSDFINIIIKYLLIQMDYSQKDCSNFAKYVGQLFANLCYNQCLKPSACYGYFTKKYKEYSDLTNSGKRKMVNKVVKGSVEELHQLHAQEYLISKINKFSSY